MVGAVPAGEGAEVGLAFRLPVAVEQDLFRRLVVARRPAMDRVFAALDIADIVEPAPVGRRDGAVVLLDPPAHLVIERFAKIDVGSEKGVLVCVLGLQIGADFRVEDRQGRASRAASRDP